jgi:hypothetical protein
MWHVFQKYKVGSHFANHSDSFGPEVSIVAIALPSACAGPRLAREARRDEIHDATPLLAIECPDVIPDREHGKHAVSLATQQDLSAVVAFFDRRNRSVLKQERSEQAPASSGK